MGDATLKPSGGDDLVLSNDDGSAKIEVNEGGDVEITPSTSLKVTLGSDSGDDFNVDSNKLVVEGDTGNVGIGVTPTHTFHSLSTDNKSFLLDRNASSQPGDLNDFSSFYSLSIKNRNGGSYLNFGGDSSKTQIQATDGASTATAKDIHLNPYGGNVAIGNGNLVIGTAGKGIDFSVNSHATGMTGEILDHYEIGTFSVTGVSGNSTFSSGSPPTLTTSANYVKIGKVVTVNASFSYTSSGWNGTQWILGGIPFNPVAIAACSWGITTRTHIESQATHFWSLMPSGMLEGHFVAQDTGGATALLSENTGGVNRTPNINFTLTYITS